MRNPSRFIFIVTIALAAAITSSAPSTTVQSAGAPVSGAPAKATVKIANFQFTPKVLTITAGTTVEWINESGRHTVQADDGSFKSDTLQTGDRFEHKFDKTGTFAYHCTFHGDKGGQDMAGKIVVRGGAKK